MPGAQTEKDQGGDKVKQLYKVEVDAQHGHHLFYGTLTREDIRYFRRCGTVTPMTPEQVEQDKATRAQAYRERLLRQL